jgi:hypothetical protein
MPTPHHGSKSTKSGEQGLLPCSPHFDKIKEVYEIEISEVALKSNGFRFSGIWLLDALNVQRASWRG